MNIIVSIKQVPESSNVKMDPETGTMMRTSVEAVINPMDLFAIETALVLKEKYDGKVTVISMGPPKAEEALREALAMRCDQAMLLSNRQFGGSDTWATAYVLSLAIQKIGDFDLVICGERATDGETGQVGPEIAANLGLPLGTFISKCMDVEDGTIRLERIVEGGREILKSKLPAVITVVKEIGVPRLATVRNKMKAKKEEIQVWGPEEIGANADWIGLKGSPTRVVEIATPKLTRKGKVIRISDSEAIKDACEQFINFLVDRELINNTEEKG